MRKARLRGIALAVLGTSAFPWLSIAGATLHLEAHATHHHRAETDATATVLHGHHHEAGTPDHEHHLTLAPVGPLPTRIAIQSLPVALGGEASASGQVPDSIAAAVTGLGHDPPHRPPSSITILRV
jgi:hypothetical protein